MFSNGRRGWLEVSLWTFFYKALIILTENFLGGAGGKESTCQCRRHGFDPRVRKKLWRRAWQPTPGFLPGKPHGQRSLAGCSPYGCRESDVTKATYLRYYTIFLHDTPYK